MLSTDVEIELCNYFMLNLISHGHGSIFNDFDNLLRAQTVSALGRKTRGFFPAAKELFPLLPSPPTNLTVVPSRHVTHTGLSVATDTQGGLIQFKKFS